ncbi:DUF6392 family protein [Pectobacterium sp. CHL-2024]|uniref:DUF6392 family protein n=1 Tax=Pectobacterium sp. CHL-2024 TaxID=3377079 RepID=UPI00382E0C70
MTVNVDALIRHLGEKYSDIIDAGLIPYKKTPKGSSGSPVLSLDMPKEGVFLAFERNKKTLIEITLMIQNKTVAGWVFPNDLPAPLLKQSKMSREWVHEVFGNPIRSTPPQVIMNESFGWVDLFSSGVRHIQTSIQIDYDEDNIVTEVAFIPTSTLRW